MQEDGSITNPLATYFVVGAFGLGAPLMAAVAESIRPNSQPVTPAFYVASYFGVLVGFVIGCFNQAVWQRTQKQLVNVIACIFASIAIVSLGVLLISWVDAILDVNSHSICGLVGLVCGSIFWEKRIKRRESDIQYSGQTP